MAIFFIVLMLGSNCKDLIHVVIFKLNQETITSIFCINKDKPELKCDGKCYLAKTMEKNAREENSRPIPPPGEKTPFESPVVILAVNMDMPTVKTARQFHYVLSTTSCFNADIAHPPESFC